MSARKSQRVFFFHFNKPASAQAKSPKWSVHWSGRCYIGDSIVCRVSETRTHQRKIQPRGVIKGVASDVSITDGIITISP